MRKNSFILKKSETENVCQNWIISLLWVVLLCFVSSTSAKSLFAFFLVMHCHSRLPRTSECLVSAKNHNNHNFQVFLKTESSTFFFARKGILRPAEAKDLCRKPLLRSPLEGPSEPLHHMFGTCRFQICGYHGPTYTFVIAMFFDFLAESLVS